MEFVKPRLNASKKRISTMLNVLVEDEREGRISEEEYKFCSERLRDLEYMQGRFQRVLPLAEKLLF